MYLKILLIAFLRNYTKLKNEYAKEPFNKSVSAKSGYMNRIYSLKNYITQVFTYEGLA